MKEIKNKKCVAAKLGKYGNVKESSKLLNHQYQRRESKPCMSYKKCNIEHLIDSDVESEILKMCVGLPSTVLASCFKDIVQFIACKPSHLNWNSPVDIIDGAFVSKAFVERLRKKLLTGQVCKTM